MTDSSVLHAEQKEEESWELYSVQRFSFDMAAEGEPWYKALCTLSHSISWSFIVCGPKTLKTCSVSQDQIVFLLSGGNSRTAMVAALSPADINYDETLSTLR